MYLDNNLLVHGSISGNTQTPANIFASGASILSANTVDLGTNRDMGEGTEYPMLHTIIGTAVSGGTSVEVQAIIADDAALSSNVTVIGSSGAIPVASLTAGKRIAVEINPQVASKGQRYLGARFVNVGANSAGSAMSFFGLDVQDGQKFYTSGFAVS